MFFGLFFEKMGASGFDGCRGAWVACRAVCRALVNPFIRTICAEDNFALAA